MSWKELLIECVENLQDQFEENELAFLSLQGKIELQLRDKIAWMLYKKGYTNVKKEYAPKDIDAGRKKCDLAILGKDLKPECLVEFKAHSSQNYESKYKKAFESDVDKMRDFVINESPELFYVFFQTYHTKEFGEGREEILVVYRDIINGAVKKYNFKSTHEADEYIKQQWVKICEREGDSDLIEMRKIDAGEYLGDRPVIYAMIYGSLKK